MKKIMIALCVAVALAVSVMGLREYSFRRSAGAEFLQTELQPKNAMAWSALAEKYLAAGRLSSAEEACKRAIKLAPGAKYHFGQLARIYEKSGETEKAEYAKREAARPSTEAIVWR